jgi:hypothetical protein
LQKGGQLANRIWPAALGQDRFAGEIAVLAVDGKRRVRVPFRDWSVWLLVGLLEGCYTSPPVVGTEHGRSLSTTRQPTTPAHTGASDKEVAVAFEVAHSQ